MLDVMSKVSFTEIVIRLATVCVILTFAGPIVAADDLELSLQNGRVTIRAQQVSVKAILSDWAVSAIPRSLTRTDWPTRS